MKNREKVWLLFHSFGIGCLSASVFLQALVFWSICKDGKFVANEQDPWILVFEVFMTTFAAIYLLYIIRERILCQTDAEVLTRKEV